MKKCTTLIVPRRAAEEGHHAFGIDLRRRVTVEGAIDDGSAAMSRPDPTPELHVAADPPGAAAVAAAEVIALLVAAVGVRGRAGIALSGGNTPRLLYRRLVALGRGAAPWDRVTFCFGDERCVPQDHVESNAGLAWRELLLPLGVTPAQVITVPAGLASDAAQRYEALLRERFGPGVPRLDLVLLGIGTDGHVASLFPGDPIVDEKISLTHAVSAPPGHAIRQRVTLTLPVINNARAVFFLATGAEKQGAVAEAIDGVGASRSPAGRVRPDGRLAWFLDASAAATP
ncbi:MAG: 6-phosphogluconolactonase [Gemmatimonadales bacterium]|nr:6-phosphogluconolactonase [Gemmatimonadales bacterium]